MKRTQCDRLLAYLKRGNTVTGLGAWEKLGIYRLASRIHDLIEAGHAIEKERITVSNRFGEDVSIVRYSLKKEEHHANQGPIVQTTLA